MSKETTSAAMIKMHKRTTLEMNRDNFDKKAISVYCDGRFKTAWKSATTEYAENVSGVNRGKRGYSSKDVADRFNSEFLGDLFPIQAANEEEYQTGCRYENGRTR